MSTKLTDIGIFNKTTTNARPKLSRQFKESVYNGGCEGFDDDPDALEDDDDPEGGEEDEGDPEDFDRKARKEPPPRKATRAKPERPAVMSRRIKQQEKPVSKYLLDSIKSALEKIVGKHRGLFRKTHATAQKLMREDLARSGIVDLAMIQQLGYMPLSRQQTRALTGHYALAYLIPYLDKDLCTVNYASGYEQKPFFRIRFLESEYTPPFSKKKIKIKGKYWQPAGSGAQLYLPPVSGVLDSWREISKTPDWILTITEGEKKAAAACLLHQIPTIALGGVFNFSDKKHNKPLLPELAGFRMIPGRHIEIVFDSDAATNPHIQQAELQLGTELANKGATVKLVRLPQLDHATKTGLDDYLKIKGCEEFDKLPRHNFRQFEELGKLFAEFALIRNPVGFLEYSTGNMYHEKQFDLLNANRFTFQPRADKKGFKQVPLGELFKQSQLRSEHAGLTFAPGQPAVLPDGSYNLWRGWGIEPATGDIGAYEELMEHLFAGQDAAQWHVENFIAHKIQHPEIKIPNLIALIGGEGFGKNILGELLGKMFGEYYAEIDGSQLTKDFNQWAERKLFILVSEIVSHDKRADSELIKAMITQQTIWVNRKYGPKFCLLDYANYFLTSNHHNPLHLEPGDRRAFIVEVCRGVDVEQAKKKALKISAGVNELKTQPEYLLHYFLKYNLKGYNPFATPPMTEAKGIAINASMSDLERFARDLRQDPDQYWIDRFDSKKVRKCDFAEMRDIQALLRRQGDQWDRTTDTALGNALHRAGFFELDQMRTHNGRKRLWVIRNFEFWRKTTSLERRQGHYNSTVPNYQSGAPNMGVVEEDGRIAPVSAAVRHRAKAATPIKTLGEKRKRPTSVGREAETRGKTNKPAGRE